MITYNGIDLAGTFNMDVSDFTIGDAPMIKEVITNIMNGVEVVSAPTPTYNQRVITLVMTYNTGGDFEELIAQKIRIERFFREHQKGELSPLPGISYLVKLYGIEETHYDSYSSKYTITFESTHPLEVVSGTTIDVDKYVGETFQNNTYTSPVKNYEVGPTHKTSISANGVYQLYANSTGDGTVNGHRFVNGIVKLPFTTKNGVLSLDIVADEPLALSFSYVITS